MRPWQRLLREAVASSLEVSKARSLEHPGLVEVDPGHSRGGMG